MSVRLPQADAAGVSAGGCGGAARMSAEERRKSERKRLPPWFRTTLPTGSAQARFNDTKSNVHEHGLNTVCEEARCPNIHDCWGQSAMIGPSKVVNLGPTGTWFDIAPSA